jgi:hypothetical protein
MTTTPKPAARVKVKPQIGPRSTCGAPAARRGSRGFVVAPADVVFTRCGVAAILCG